MLHLRAVLVKEVIDVVPHQHEPPTDVVVQVIVVLLLELLLRIDVFIFGFLITLISRYLQKSMWSKTYTIPKSKGTHSLYERTNLNLVNKSVSYCTQEPGHMLT